MEYSEYEKFVPNVHFEQIPIKNLVSNQEYQRNLSQRHINRTIKNFDVYQINPIKVSRRDGLNYVVNGQHTIEIVAAVSGSRDTPVWCMVYDDMEYRHEADIFANQQKYIKTLSAYEIFRANIEAGNDVQLMIRDLVESFKLSIASSSGDCVICAVNALEEIYNNYGFHILRRTLKLCVASWEGDRYSLSGKILKGIAKLTATYGERLSDDYFIEKLGNFSVREISRSARERGGGTSGYAEAILSVYNRKIKSQLDISELSRTANKTAEPDAEENG